MDDGAFALLVGGRRILPPVGVGPGGWRLAIGAGCADDDVAPLLPLVVAPVAAEPRGFFLRYGLAIAMMEQRRKGTIQIGYCGGSKPSNGLDAEKVKARYSKCELRTDEGAPPPNSTTQLENEHEMCRKTRYGAKSKPMYSVEAKPK